jgi:hypothetical protein
MGGRKGAGHKAYLTKIRNQRALKQSLSNRGKIRKKSKGQVVGFYKDHGKTKPITKSVAQLKRKKVVKTGRQFRAVGPLVAGYRVKFFQTNTKEDLDEQWFRLRSDAQLWAKYQKAYQDGTCARISTVRGKSISSHF